MNSSGEISCIVSVILFLAYLPRSDSIRCYKCTTTSPSTYSNETKRLCSNFDYSERYIVDCPYSTFCMKKDFSVNLPVPVNGTSRDCAYQKYETQKYSNGQWRPEVYVEEAYEEGCSTVDDKGQRTSITQYCYCRGDLCNASIKIDAPYCIKLLLSVIFLHFKFLK